MGKDRTSALYYLVWHIGYSYAEAVKFLERYPSALPILADEGRRLGRKCFYSLALMVDALANDR